MTSIWWIRRDLRLTDNPALQAALEVGPVIPVFVLDPAFSRSAPRRKNFLYEGLHASIRICGRAIPILLFVTADLLKFCASYWEK